MAKLKIGGVWSGVLEVELEEWTIPMLREEIAKRSSSGFESINLIWAGKVLKDGDGTQKLSQLGVKNNAKILASRITADQGKALKDELVEAEERSTRLTRLKAAVASLAKRHADGSLPIEDFNIVLENQSGEAVEMGSEDDRRAAMMGLMLHETGKGLIRSEKYKEALEVLTMGEEAFALCNSKMLELIDNAAILQIDMVWCYFMLRDISWLSVAGERLSKAREGIERSHGKESSRLRLLQAGCHPEIALYLRMELLEGVLAYHSGQLQKSRQALVSAQTKFLKLQVSDEALSLLVSMGHKERRAKRALRMNNQDVGSAMDFLVAEQAKKAQKREDDIRRRDEIMEQKRYGVTPLKKAVNLQRLNELVSIGYEKDLAAEALRRNENDTQKALDDLTNPEANSALQHSIESRKRKRQANAAAAAVEQLVAMGFPRAAVTEAVRIYGTKNEALNHLVGQPHLNPPLATDGNANVPSAIPGASEQMSTDDNNLFGESSSGNDGLPSYFKPEEWDAEMEDEVTRELHKKDVFSDYDIEVTREGEAIKEYLAMLDSTSEVEVPTQ